jgi:hypothetical protein
MSLTDAALQTWAFIGQPKGFSTVQVLQSTGRGNYHSVDVLFLP